MLGAWLTPLTSWLGLSLIELLVLVFIIIYFIKN